MSMSTYVFWNYRPIGERTLTEFVQQGITQIELLESREQFDMSDQRSMRYIADICRSCGIRIVAYHAHSTDFKEVDTEKKRKTEVDRCRRQIDTMIEMGGKVWGSHARSMNGNIEKSYEDLARYIEGTDAVITIENFKEEECWVNKRLAFLDRIDHPQVGMILDVGRVRNKNGINSMTVLGGPTKVIDMCKKRLCWVHLHGFRDDEDHVPPFDEGDMMQWVEIFRMLREIGYSRNLNFEPRGEPVHFNTIEKTAKALKRIFSLEASAPQSDHKGV
jgi:sugar phosphate isomerase/epimerase